MKAIIAFAAGRGGRVDGKPNNNCGPDKLVEATATFGRTSRVPMLWLYIENDTFFGSELSKRMYAAFTGAGGPRHHIWRLGKICFKPGGAKMVCRTTIAGHFETGQIAVRAYIVEREDQSTARLQMFLPVGLYMPAGFKLTVDKGTAHKIPYTWCLTNTCIAGDVANPHLIGEMESGANLVIEVVDTNMLAVTTSLPVHRFAAIRKGAPTKIFTQNIDE